MRGVRVAQIVETEPGQGGIADLPHPFVSDEGWLHSAFHALDDGNLPGGEIHSAPAKGGNLAAPHATEDP